MINGNACFAYFNKNWGIPRSIRRGMYRLPLSETNTFRLSLEIQPPSRAST
jgi:hypothetical protein